MPDRSSGYHTSDAALALVVSIRAGRIAPETRPEAIRVCRTSLAFLVHAQCADGRFRDALSYERTWLDDAGSQESNGRALWSLGVALRAAPEFGLRAAARDVLDRALPTIASLDNLSSRAFAALGIVEALRALDESPASDAGRRGSLLEALDVLGEALLEAYTAASSPSWLWFENVMTPCGARLCEALLRIGDVLGAPSLLAAASKTLSFFGRATIATGVFAPLGTEGGWTRSGSRARYDQSPAAAAAFVDAALAAARAARRHPNSRLAAAEDYEAMARLGRDWFDGANVLGHSLVTASGACADGIEATGPSANSGADATLSYLASAYALAGYERSVRSVRSSGASGERIR